jgi:hypothetical protein
LFEKRRQSYLRARPGRFDIDLVDRRRQRILPRDWFAVRSQWDELRWLAILSSANLLPTLAFDLVKFLFQGSIAFPQFVFLPLQQRSVERLRFSEDPRPGEKNKNGCRD